MLEASVKDPMMALEKKLISMNSRCGQGFTALSTLANHQETVSISVFSAILTVQEESIQSEVAGVNDEVDEGSIPWRFFKFVDPGMHGKVEAVLRKNCLKPMTEPLWFRQAEPAVLLCFWANEGMTDTFVLQQQCFKQKPAASWPVDLRVSPCGEFWTAPTDSVTPDRIISVKATVVVTESQKTPQIQMTKQFQKCEIQKALFVLDSKLDMVQIESHVCWKKFLSSCCEAFSVSEHL